MEKAALDAHNRKIIDEFRANGGHVGGEYEGMPLLLLHHVGAKTGAARVNPMTYLRLDTGYAVFAANAAGPANPDWYHNLTVHPKVTVEVGSEIVQVVARVAAGTERARIWSRQKAVNPLFAEFERRTPREIPVIVLDALS